MELPKLFNLLQIFRGLLTHFSICPTNKKVEDLKAAVLGNGLLELTVPFPLLQPPMS
jgi:hypothetical protein